MALHAIILEDVIKTIDAPGSVSQRQAPNSTGNKVQERCVSDQCTADEGMCFYAPRQATILI